MQYVLRLLAREITEQQIDAVKQFMLQQGFSIDQIKSLSTIYAVQELTVTGVIVDAQQLKSDLLALASKLGLDIVLQEAQSSKVAYGLAVFDMDSTLIQAEVIDELAKAAGVGDQVIDITAAAMRGEIDFNESFAQRLALLKGLDEQVLASIAANLPITEGLQRLMQKLNKLGIKTAILSGGFTYFAQSLQQRFGFDYIYANTLDIVEGKLSGEVGAGTIVNAARKAELLIELAKKEQLSLEQTIAVGDGANDLMMLAAAGLGVAFHAKPKVREQADYSLSLLGLDAVLYLMGYSDVELEALDTK